MAKGRSICCSAIVDLSTRYASNNLISPAQARGGKHTARLYNPETLIQNNEQPSAKGMRAERVKVVDKEDQIPKINEYPMQLAEKPKSDPLHGFPDPDPIIQVTEIAVLEKQQREKAAKKAAGEREAKRAAQQKKLEAARAKVERLKREPTSPGNDNSSKENPSVVETTNLDVDEVSYNLYVYDLDNGYLTFTHGGPGDGDIVSGFQRQIQQYDSGEDGQYDTDEDGSAAENRTGEIGAFNHQ
ncbi:hypothetical protein MMC22_003861 [Lobaria immixta]|nr:hypothetical protein [Lobaria immixta]